MLLNRTCRDWFKGITENCIQNNAKADGQRDYARCSYCDISNQDVLSKDVSTTHGVCTEDSLLRHFYEPQVVANCKNYTYNTTTKSLVCQECH